MPPGAEPERFALRLAFLLDGVRDLPPGTRVLDAGCGEGAFGAALLERGLAPVCVDAADEPLRRLRRRFPALGDVRRCPPGGPLPLADGEASAAWAGEVLEHVVDVGAFAGELRRVVAPGGPLLVTTPDHPRRRVARLAISGRAFDEHFSPYADHVRFFSRRTLTRVLTDAGFARVAVRARGGHLLARAT